MLKAWTQSSTPGHSPYRLNIFSALICDPEKSALQMALALSPARHPLILVSLFFVLSSGVCPGTHVKQGLTVFQAKDENLCHGARTYETSGGKKTVEHQAKGL